MSKYEMKDMGLQLGIIKKIRNELDVIKNNSKPTSVLRSKQKINYSSFKKLDEVLHKYVINRVDTFEIKLLTDLNIESR